jgi:hypothetical protein
VPPERQAVKRYLQVAGGQGLRQKYLDRPKFMPQPNSQIDIGNFTLTIPKEWEADIDEGVLSIFKSDNGVGAIQISSYSLDLDAQFDLFDEFHELVTDTLTIQLEKNWAKEAKQLRDNFLIFETSVTSENKFFIVGLCEHKRSILFLTYNCILDDKNLEYNDVLSFFSSVTFSNTVDK